MDPSGGAFLPQLQQQQQGMSSSSFPRSSSNASLARSGSGGSGAGRGRGGGTRGRKMMRRVCRGVITFIFAIGTYQPRLKLNLPPRAFTFPTLAVLLLL